MSILERFFGSQRGKKINALLNDLRAEINELVAMVGPENDYLDQKVAEQEEKIHKQSQRIKALERSKSGLLNDLNKLKTKLREVKGGKNSD